VVVCRTLAPYSLTLLLNLVLHSQPEPGDMVTLAPGNHSSLLVMHGSRYAAYDSLSRSRCTHYRITTRASMQSPSDPGATNPVTKLE
jgi:hypothetical protein